jgi:hypothetical protein
VAFLVTSPNAEITFPKANRPQLIEIPSLALSPVAPVRFNLSEPMSQKLLPQKIIKKLEDYNVVYLLNQQNGI